MMTKHSLENMIAKCSWKKSFNNNPVSFLEHIVTSGRESQVEYVETNASAVVKCFE